MPIFFSIVSGQRSIGIFLFLLLLLTSSLSSSFTEAALKPKEIAILVNKDSPHSVRLGRLYTQLRKVPEDNIILLSVPTAEWISRDGYDNFIAPPVRKALGRLHDKGVTIRCLVTTYGIPLRIDAVKPLIVSPALEELTRTRKLRQRERARLRQEKKEGNRPVEELNEEIRKVRSEINDLNFRIGRLDGSETIAAVDSELALVLFPDYSLNGSIRNPEFLPNRGRLSGYMSRTLMVSRLDGPSPELAAGLVLTAIEVEQTGLSGRVYLDARGKTGKDAYGAFDADIRRTATILNAGSLPVVLDNRPGVFQPGEAPEAALYCGWYSLSRYVDAFTWVPGAVGYHVASAEAVSLRESRPAYWVKSMIEKGVIGTVGPVSEPYLEAFPPPSIFFPLLMSGKYTLMEVFALSNPLVSWRMILIGDPLYSPFQRAPALSVENPPLPPQ